MLVRSIVLSLFVAAPLFADGPEDNDPTKVRAVPPVGIAVDRTTGVNLLFRAKQIDLEVAKLADQTYAPDITVITRAVRGAVERQEFYRPADVDNAGKLLDLAAFRVRELQEHGKPTWLTKPLNVGGFVSKIDGSVQPFGLVVPESYDPKGHAKFKLDVWLHGRGERTLENQFLTQRLSRSSQYEPADTFVLHPYGRYSNAFKFAGEIDVLEAIDAVKERYRIDDDRIAIRGFSMGGAGCWQMAVHYADRFYAATPGAGFAETPLFLRSFQGETLAPKPWEQTLWKWYDCPGWGVNLSQCPTIAYSGENDIQKQAADVMENSLARDGIDLVHVIGPETGHSIHADSKQIIQAKVDALAEIGRINRPQVIHFATHTLRYNRMHWLVVDGLESHWERATVDAELLTGNRVRVVTRNVSAFTLELGPGEATFDITEPVRIQVDGTVLLGRPARSDRSWRASFVKDGGDWRLGSFRPDLVRKQHGLTGPIDDAFMDSFVFVRPTLRPRYQQTAEWVDAELERAVREWRRHFRGDVRIIDDRDLDDDHIDNSHLVLWGDPWSNIILRYVYRDLPIVRWNSQVVDVAGCEQDARFHMPVLIAPNPLNPKKYVVVNSGFTYREYAYLNNARQVPMLPDWAIVDIRQQNAVDWPRTRWPGRIVEAGFFDERWQARLP